MNEELKGFLKDAKDSLISLDEMKKNINALKGKVTTFEKKKEDFDENIRITTNKAIKENKDALLKSYDEIILEVEKRLKTSESEKAREKKKNLDTLIEKNTRVNKDNNEYLRNEIKKVMHENKLPFFVNSKLYFILFFPTSFSELIIAFILFIIFIIGVPAGIWYLVGPKVFTNIAELIQNKSFWTAFIYIAIYLFVVGILYLFIDSATKKDKKALLDIKELRKNIKDNIKDIMKITKDTVKNIKDEDFDYTKLDRDIEGIKFELENANNKKKEALETFENVTREKIIDDIKSANKQELIDIEKELLSAHEELATLEKKYTDLRLEISEKYEIKLGKNNTSVEKINQLMNALDKSNEEIELSKLIETVNKY